MVIGSRPLLLNAAELRPALRPLPQPGRDKAGGQCLVIHPPSRPFVRQGLAAAQQRPLSSTD